MKQLVYKLRRDTLQRPITEADPLSRHDLDGRLYHVRITYSREDKADDTATPLAIEDLGNGFYRSRLPRKRSLIQIEGIVSEAWFPRLYDNGEVQIFGAERIRYQTLRDGILYKPTRLVDAMIIDLQPYLVVNTDTAYRLPQREGRFYLGPTYFVGEGDYISHGVRHAKNVNTPVEVPYIRPVSLPGGVYERRKFGAIRIGEYTLSLPTATIRESVKPTSDGFNHWKADIDWTSRDAPQRLDDSTAARLKTVIDTLTNLKHHEDASADADWLLRCAVAGRNVEEYVYFRDKPTGVYAKEISSS